MIRSGAGILVVWVLAALLVRGALADLLTVWGVRPDLLVIVIVYWALAAGPVPGTLAGFFVGLVADADLGRGLGLQAGLFSLTGFLVGQAGRQLIRENPFLQGALVTLAAAAVGMGRVAVLLGDQPARALMNALPLVLGSALYSGVLAPIVYWLLGRLGLPDPLARVPQEE